MSQEKLDWNSLAQHGVCVSIKSRIWQGRRKLELSDIGLYLNDQQKRELEGKVSLGSKFIFNPEILKPFNTFKSRAREVLAARGISIGTITGTFFIPDNNFEIMRLELNNIISEFNSYKRYVLDNFKKMSEEWLDTYREYAIVNIHNRLNLEMDEELFATRFMSRIKLLLPTVEELEDKFELYWVPFQINAPSNVYTDEGQEIVQRASIKKHAEEAMHKQMEDLLGDVFSTLRTEVIEAVTHVSDVIKYGKKFTVKTMNSLKKKVERVKSLNFLDDEDLNHKISQLEKLCNDSSIVNAKTPGELYKLQESLNLITSDIVSVTNNKEKTKVVRNFSRFGGRKVKKLK